MRRARGEAALAHAGREHGVDRVAELYASALEQAAGGEAVREAVLAEIAVAAAAVGIEVSSDEAGELARRLAEVRIAE